MDMDAEVDAAVPVTSSADDDAGRADVVHDLRRILDEKDAELRKQSVEIEDLRSRVQFLESDKDSLLCEVNKLRFELEMSGLVNHLQQDSVSSAPNSSRSTDRGSSNSSAANSGPANQRQFKCHSTDVVIGGGSPSVGHQTLQQRLRQRSITSGATTGRRVVCRTAEDLIKSSRTPTLYELSQDLLDKQVEVLERKYGGQTRASHAALTIQRAFRKYCMLKKFQDITSANSEKRLSRRFNGTTENLAAAVANSGQQQQDNGIDDIGQHNFEVMCRELHNDSFVTTGSDEVSGSGRPPRSVRSLSLREPRPGSHLSSDGTSTSSSSSSSRGRPRRTKGSRDETTTTTAVNCDLEHSLHGATSQCRQRNGHNSSNSARQAYVQVHHGNFVGANADGQFFYSSADGQNDLRRSEGAVCTAAVGRRCAACPRMVSSMSAMDASSRRNSAPPTNSELLKKKVPPEVPKRTSSITSRNLDGTSCCGIERGSNGDLLLSPDGGSLSSVQSSGSESSLTGSSSDRAYSSRADDSFGRTSADSMNTSVVSHEHFQHPSPLLEDKRLSNISENSEDSFGGTGYSSSPPVSEGAFSHGPCETPMPVLAGYSKVSEVVRKRQYRVGLNLFNKKPEKGIYYLIHRAFLENAPQAVARFLVSRKGLSKQMIGEYLGNLQNSFNMEVLECFAGEIDLAGMQVDVALRKFQTCFRMPGEAQKIERLVEVFSCRYCECNRDIVSRFNNADTVFILAFAIIMLNTDLHTPNLKPEKRMKPEDFVRNLRGVDEGCDIEVNMLLGIYERIKLNEFRPGSDHVTQVMKVQQTIVGKKPTLALPHRRLVCYCRLYEVNDVNKKERQGLHQREVFLFNDLLVVTKILSKKKNGVTYTFRQSFPLCGLQVNLFQVPHYPQGIQLAQKVDGKIVIVFNARNEHDRTKFVEDLKESILEMDEMENMRIECELEKQQKLARTRATENRDSGVADMEIPSVVVVVNGADDDKAPANNVANGGLKRSTLSNSLLDIHEQIDKPQRRGSAGSLDSGMSVSFQSSVASLGSRDSSPHQGIYSNGKAVPNGSKHHSPAALSANQSFLGGLFGKKVRNHSKTNVKAMGNSTDSATEM